jgi:hypothetical protein
MSEKETIFHHVDDDDDAVGYGKPPKHTRFKRGQSGNPKGRKRRMAHEEAENPLRMYMLEQMTVMMKGKRVKMPVVDVIIKSMIQKAATGDYRSQKLLIQESGGLKALREEHKHQRTQADQEFINEVRKEADKWLSTQLSDETTKNWIR